METRAKLVIYALMFDPNNLKLKASFRGALILGNFELVLLIFADVLDANLAAEGREDTVFGSIDY